MRILIVSYFCPPEWAAPASRIFEYANRLSGMGHDVTILTGLPNHPGGKIYRGYRFRLFQREKMGKVKIVRVGSLISPNTTPFQRLKAYLSLTAAQIFGSLFTGPADVVIGTSPPLFTAFAGYVAGRLKRCPFVLEVRDLWPENMVAIGALKNRWAVRLLGALERFLYMRATRIISVTQGFRSYIIDKGVPPEKVRVITNGVNMDDYPPQEYPVDLARELGLENRFVVAYIGTLGINHGLHMMLDTAERLSDKPEVVFLIVGDGADRELLKADVMRRKLQNLRFIGARPRSEMPAFHALADVIAVPLKKADYFRRVIPSKIFVAMAMAKPVLISVEGESREIIENAGAGIGIEPENAQSMVQAILALLEMRKTGGLERMGENGRNAIAEHYDWEQLSSAYHDELVSCR
ncbi:MAG: glycosyltransferase family 4 protein [Planctomycetota bacterium]